ncbi:MAG: hybrid sensor histidine kinase/response regulator [Anaerolineae bacterium]|nr:hybrid sensor histidine kinase/response regulator [Anaerolineae bacterium]
MTEKPQILYVEDDPSSATLVQRVLGAEGYNVTVVTDGMAALEMGQRMQPVLVLMDINISGMDGYEVTTRLRAFDHIKDVPIVAVTAAALRGDRERALIAGCSGYIPKPIDIDRFPEQVQEFIGGMREEVESEEKKSEYLVEYSRRLVERLEEKIRELQQAHEDLQHLERMKSDFVILAGHELRTPLTVIYGYNQLLLTMPDIPGAVDEEGSPRYLISQVAEATKRLSQVVEDILNVTLIDANKLDLKIVPIEINTMVESVIKNLTSLDAGRSLEFVFDNLENLPPLRVDSQRIYQVLWNVISNSVKYTPDGGTITLSGRVLEDTVHLTIKDTGIGIDPQERDRIFDRFYVLENTSLHRTSKTAFKGGGMGLGLTVARGIVEAHGGKIWVESEGRDEEKLPGSTFHILLPLPT